MEILIGAVIFGGVVWFIWNKKKGSSGGTGGGGGNGGPADGGNQNLK